MMDIDKFLTNPNAFQDPVVLADAISELSMLSTYYYCAKRNLEQAQLKSSHVLTLAKRLNELYNNPEQIVIAED